MDPLTIIALIQAGIKAAPDAAKFIKATKDYIVDLFAGGVIDIDTQDKLHAYCDAAMNAAIAGEVPPHWQNEPDPE